MKKLRVHFTAAVCLNALISPVFADTRQTPTLTLGQALRAAPAETQITIAVGADAIGLPALRNAPGSSESAADIARDFGMSTEAFGSVRAIAPAAMYQYNDLPQDPDPFDGMPSPDIARRFAATLDGAQWHLFTDRQGIGLSDLKSSLQRALFLGLFPGHEIHAAPDKPLTADDIRKRLTAPDAGTAVKVKTLMDLTPQLSGARLRLGLRTELSLAGSTATQSSQPARLAVPGAPQYFAMIAPPSSSSVDRLFGIVFRESAPAKSKAGELDWTLPALRQTIMPGKDKTAGDLINRVAAATGLEIIAARAIEGRPITVTGSAAPIPAADLLRAIAYASAATYRRVGTAYILTGDVTGEAVLRQRWVEAEETVNRLRRDSAQPQNGQTTDFRRLEDLSVLPGALIPTDAQRNAWLHPAAGSATVPYKDLTPEEQQTVTTQLETRKAFLDVVKAQHPEIAGTLLAPPAVTPETQINVAIHPDLEADIPTLPGPIAFDLGAYLDDILAPLPNTAPGSVTSTIKPLGLKLPPGADTASIPDVIRRFPRRAIQAQPRTVAEVSLIIASMQKLGLNELWLDVFSGGKAHTKIAGITGDTDADIFGEALRIGPPAGIRVLPAVDFYLWDDSAPADIRDRNIYGEDSAEAYNHQMRVYDDPGAEVENGDIPRRLPASSIAVNPMHPTVQARLGQLLRFLAAQPGIDGIVWRETEPAGYRVSDGGQDATILDLGCTPEMRLAFLRKTHTDPIDILPASYAKPDQFLRTSNDPSAGDMDAAWRTMLGDAKHAGLRTLYDTTQQTAGNHKLSIFLRQAGYSDGGVGWYGAWDDPTKPIPTYRSPNRYIAELSTQSRPGPWVVQAKAQSKTALYLIPPSASRSAAALAAELTAHVQGKPWDGFVIDLRRDSIAYQDSKDYPADPVAAFTVGK